MVPGRGSNASQRSHVANVLAWGLLGMGLALVALAASASATNVGGTISVDTTWTLAGSPYVVTSTINVQGTSGADGVTTLTVEPGVEVRFQQSTYLHVGTNSATIPGALVADGTPGSPITFTSDQAVHTRGYWGYLQFNDYSSDSISILDNVVIEYGGVGTANLYLYYASPAMSSLTVRESGAHGMYITESTGTISGSTFANNDDHGVFVYGGTPTFSGDTFSDNGLYGAFTNHGNPGFVNNVFDSNAQRPLRMNPDAAFSGNTFTASVTHEIELLGETINFDRTLPRHLDTTSSNLLAYVVTGQLTVYGTAGGDGVTTLTLAPGVELRFDQYQGLQVGGNAASQPGALDARGTAALPILLTSNQVTKTRGWWSYLSFYDYSSDALSVLENVTLEYGGSSTAGLYLYQAAPKVVDCTLRESGQHGAYLYYSSVRFQDCTVKDNSKHGIYVYSSTAAGFDGGLVKGNGLYGVYQEYSGSTFDLTNSALETNAQRIARLHPASSFHGNTYTGNGIDEIEFLGDAVEVDRTWWRLLDSGDSTPINFVVVSTITVRGTDGGDGITALTIEPGVTVAFDQYAAFTIASNSATLPGALVADGTAALPIVFTSHQSGTKTKGWWGPVHFYDYTSDTITKLENVTIEYGGYSTGGAYFYYASPQLGNCVFSNNNNHGVYIYESAAVFHDCSFLNSQNHGVYVYTGGTLSATVRSSTLKGNAQYGLYTNSGTPDVYDSLFENNTQRPMRVAPDSRITGNSFKGNTIQEIEFNGGTHSLDKTLVRHTDVDTGDPLTYVYVGSATVQGTAGADGVTTLTLDSGVTVAFDQYAGMTVAGNSATYQGALVADGTAALPVVFTSHQSGTKTKGYWGPLRFYDYASDTISKLENVTIEYGGYSTSALYLYYYDGAFKNCTVRESSNHGAYLYESGAVFDGCSFLNSQNHGAYVYTGSTVSATFKGSTFKGNAQYGLYTNSGEPDVYDNLFENNTQRPMRVAPDSRITGNSFKGNTIQEIEFNGGTHSLDKTLVRYTDTVSGVPLAYVYVGTATVLGTDGADGTTSLTVEPGVTVAFDQNVAFNVAGNSASQPGALVADGTAALPIVFTSHQTGTKTKGWWGPVHFYDYSSDTITKLENVTVEYGGYSTGGAYFYYASPKVGNCVFSNNNNYGVYLYESASEFHGCSFLNSQNHGVYVYSATSNFPTIRGSTLKGNAQYGLYTNSGTPDVYDNLFEANTQRPLRVDPDSLITGNTFKTNTIQEIEFLGGTHSFDKTLVRHTDSVSGVPLTYVYTGTSYVQGTDGGDGVTTLTVDDGVTVAFDSGVALYVGSNVASTPGALVADGTPLPIVFTSHQTSKTRGYWGPLTFYDYADEAITTLRNITVEYGGYSTAGVYLYNSSPTMQDCVVRQNNNHGIYYYNEGGLLERCTVSNNQKHGVYVSGGSPTVKGNTLLANSQYGVYTESGTPDAFDNLFEANTQRPLRVAPDSLITGNTFKANTIQEIEFNGGTHSLDKTLLRYTDTVSGVPLTYVYTGTSYVQGTDGADGVTGLTVDPGVTVAFNQYVALYVGSNNANNPGALVADGTAAMPTVFTSHQSGTKAKGYWGPLTFYDHAQEGLTVLQNLTVEYGGYSTGAVYLYNFAPVAGNLAVTNSGTHGIYNYGGDAQLTGCTLQDNTNHGFYNINGFPVLRNCLLKGNSQYGLYTNADRADITGSTLQGNKQRPLRLHPEADFSGSVFRSNVIQDVEFNGGTVDEDEHLTLLVDADTAVTLRYVYVASITVRGTDGPDGVTTLAVDPGVTVAFTAGTDATFGGSTTIPGALSALGTAAQPITFTSSKVSPVAGDWGGLRFTYSEAPSVLRNVTVSYAGQSTGAVYVYDTLADIQDSRVFRSSTYGVHLANVNNLRFAGNEVFLNTQRGIHIASGNGYEVVGNRVHNSSYGLYVAGGMGSTIEGNTIVDNAQRGMYLAGSTHLVYNNLFRNPTNAEDQGTGNRWNTTKTAAAPGANIIGGAYFGGNRWSNYSGLDRDYDGLGDTLVPHKTIGKGLDSHPLTLPTEVLPDTLPPVTLASYAGTAGSAGWWRSAVTVTLSATDDGSGVKATYYRVNGGAQQSYAAPFTFSNEGANAIEFWSVDNANNVEATKTGSGSVDATAPATGAALAGTPGPGGWYASAVTVTLSATDATSGVATTEYRLDGGLFAPYGGPVPVTADGAHTVDFRSTDVAGNEETTKTVQVRIDTLPPETARALTGTPGNAGWWRSAVTATLTATDAGSGVASTQRRLDGGAWQLYTSPLSIAGEGAHGLDYYSVDNVGHVEATKSVAVNIDSVAPATTFAAGPPVWQDASGLYVRSASSLSLSATDATSGVAATRYQVALGGSFAAPAADDEADPLAPPLLLGGKAREPVARALEAEGIVVQAFADYAGPFQLSGADGARTVSYYSVDVAGNQEATRNQVVKLDNTPPTLEVSRPRVGSLSAFSLYVETDSDWDASPDALETALGTKPYDPASRPFTLPPAVADIHARFGYAYVVAGTAVPLTASATDPVVNGVASGMDRVDFLLDGVLLGSDDAAPFVFDWETSGLALGPHVVTVRALDHLGNQREVDLKVYGLALPQDADQLVAALSAFLPPGPVASEGPTVAVARPAETVHVEARVFLAMLEAVETRQARELGETPR